MVVMEVRVLQDHVLLILAIQATNLALIHATIRVTVLHVDT